ncbi:MAG: hypothetical protein AAF654_07020 [Myxococcota bacterium]
MQLPMTSFPEPATASPLPELVAVETLRWVLAHTLSQREALSICRCAGACTQLPGPLYLCAALVAWRCERGWCRCENAMAKARRGRGWRRWFFDVPAEVDDRSVDEVWSLLVREREHC